MIDFKIDESFIITTIDYTTLKHKPSINGVELNGELSLADIGITVLNNKNIDDILTEVWA